MSGTAIFLVGATLLEGYGKYEAGQSRAAALQAREKQEKIAYDNRSIQRAEQLQRALASQVGSAASRGITISSPTFSAITEDEFNEYYKDERADKLSLKYSDDAYDAEIENAQISGEIGLGKNLFEAATYMTNQGEGINRYGNVTDRKENV